MDKSIRWSTHQLINQFIYVWPNCLITSLINEMVDKLMKAWMNELIVLFIDWKTTGLKLKKIKNTNKTPSKKVEGTLPTTPGCSRRSVRPPRQTRTLSSAPPPCRPTWCRLAAAKAQGPSCYKHKQHKKGHTHVHKLTNAVTRPTFLYESTKQHTQ